MNLLDVQDLAVAFGGVRVVDGVSFSVAAGERVGIVGESGSGKTMTVRAALGLLPPAARVSGRVRFEGEDVLAMSPMRLRAMRGARAAMVFQDPMTSFNPVLSVGNEVGEAITVHRRTPRARLRAAVAGLLGRVGIDRAAERSRLYPHEFSGGQRQRIGIARALILQPDFIVADEPVSALDVSIQAQIINLLQDLKAEMGLTYLFIAHDLAVVRHVSDRVAVMYRGRLVEVAPAATLFRRPLHPYTQLLLRSVPIPDTAAEAARLAGLAARPEAELAAPPPNGCAFAPRCPLARFPICAEERPPLSTRHGETLAACHFADDQRAVAGGVEQAA